MKDKMTETEYLLSSKKDTEALLTSISQIQQGKILHFPKMQSYQDFHTFLTLHIPALTPIQAKKLAELLLLDFLENLPNEFYQHELPSQKPHFEALYQTVKEPIDTWDLTKIKDHFYAFDKITEEMGDDYPADMDSNALNFLVFIEDYLIVKRMKSPQKILAKTLDFVVRYFDWVDSNLEKTSDLDTWTTHPQIQPSINKFIDFFNQVRNL